VVLESGDLFSARRQQQLAWNYSWQYQHRSEINQSINQ